MSVDPSCTDRANSFALVSYIPEPLAEFLDALRRELVPDCFLRAHVTILPPRPASSTAEVAWSQIREASRWFRPFTIDLESVELFPVSDVIYLSLGRGEKELRFMHAILNAGGMSFRERYPYHPHITLAQNLTPQERDECVLIARRRWLEFPRPHHFEVERVTFVQSTINKTWIDLEECLLGPEREQAVAAAYLPDSNCVLTV